MPVNPPRPRGPSLNALRAFESAARLSGFSKAAEELSVSPGAIAQHVKTLEDWAGAPLFTRHPQGLSLTTLGRDTLGALTAAFDQLGTAVQALRAQARPDRVHIAALPSIAQLWLSPRLPAIRAAMPDLSLSVTALETPPNLVRDPYDLSLFMASEGGQALESDMIYPVCTPQMAGRVNAVEDLQTLPCLSDATWADDWETWLKFAAPRRRLSVSGPAFSLYALAVQEAVNGAGVLMAHSTLIRPQLEQGTLVNPLGPKVETGLSISLQTRPGPLAPPLRRLCGLLAGAPGL